MTNGTYHNIEKLANELSDEQFELLLRNRLQAAFNMLAPSENLIMLTASTGYGKEQEVKDVKWIIGTSGGIQTRGEILPLCVAEYNRRVDFEQTSTLRLIEASPEAIDTTELDAALSK